MFIFEFESGLQLLYNYNLHKFNLQTGSASKIYDLIKRYIFSLKS